MFRLFKVAAVLCALMPLQATAQTATEADAAEFLTETALEPWTGDLDGIAERGFLRIAVPHNPLFIVFDGEKQIGLAVDAARELTKHLAEAHKIKLTPVLMPLPRDRMLPGLAKGEVDLVIANLTVTEERAKTVAFTDPLRKGVKEIVITGPKAGDVASFDDLVDHGLALRRSSSYFTHAEALNAARKEAGKPEIPLTEVEEVLEDRDLLEMVQAGLIPAVVVDDHKAELWAQAFDKLVLHPDLALNDGGEIAWALRQESPKFLEALNGFVDKIEKGTLLGNMLDKRYLASPEWVLKSTANDDIDRAKGVQEVIRERAPDYEFDWKLIVAQGYQESRLDQSARSKAGAVGVMQLLPSTAKDKNVGIADISTVENNVHAGVKYLRFLMDRYYSEPEISDLDRKLFSLAAYNAGPGNISKARKRAVKMGLDPNVWFDNVETATAKAVSREPVIYVRNIFKYAVFIRLREDARAAKLENKSAAE